jgi:3-oxoacyl-[acyl-carrier-protein] synthase II
MQNMRRRVVITGIGILSPIGNTTESFWQNALEAKTSVSKIPEKWETYASYRSRLWAPLQKISFDKYHITRVDRMQLDYTVLMMIAATIQALDNAGIRYSLVDEKKNINQLQSINPYRAGSFIGTGIGGTCSLITAETSHLFYNQHIIFPLIKEKYRNLNDFKKFCDSFEPIHQYLMKNPRFNPFIVSMIMPNAIAANLGIRFGLKGANRTNATACASGTIAIGDAFRSIRSNSLDFALAGGVEYLGDEFGGVFRGFDSAKTLTQQNSEPYKANRPFDKKRDGFLFSEGGGCVLILEELSHAQKRGAPILCEIRGYAESYDAYNIMMIEPNGKEIMRMLSDLLAGNNMKAPEIDYINSHGTGTLSNDEIESYVIEKMFPKTVAVNSTKSLIGHTIGASGAIEAAVTALSIRDQKTHICLNLEEPVRDINFVMNTQPRKIISAISQSFAFGGNNAALLLTQYKN